MWEAGSLRRSIAPGTDEPKNGREARLVSCCNHGSRLEPLSGRLCSPEHLRSVCSHLGPSPRAVLSVPLSELLLVRFHPVRPKHKPATCWCIREKLGAASWESHPH